jgi:outer membrane immunogenic protein
MKRLVLVAIALMTLNTWAKDLTSEMDALGANKDLMKKAKAIDPDNKVRVVQNREVDRNYRLELGLNYGANASGGDPYVNTSAVGGQLDFHFTPRWSLGARYSSYQNKLTSEGTSVLDDADRRIKAGEQGVRVPGYTWAKNSYLIVGDFYPIYGKLNLFDAAIAQFDVYLIGGAGQITLGTGSAPLYTAGAGVGFWLSKHVSSRFEARWEGHTEQVDYGTGLGLQNRTMNETIIQASIGFLL